MRHIRAAVDGYRVIGFGVHQEDRVGFLILSQ